MCWMFLVQWRHNDGYSLYSRCYYKSQSELLGSVLELEHESRDSDERGGNDGKGCHASPQLMAKITFAINFVRAGLIIVIIIITTIITSTIIIITITINTTIWLQHHRDNLTLSLSSQLHCCLTYL